MNNQNFWRIINYRSFISSSLSNALITGYIFQSLLSKVLDHQPSKMITIKIVRHHNADTQEPLKKVLTMILWAAQFSIKFSTKQIYYLAIFGFFHLDAIFFPV